MVQDVDNLQLAKESYLFSENGRVIFNEDGTYAWETAKGTSAAFTIDANYGNGIIGQNVYTSIGGWQINGKLLIFSTNGINSELGLVYEDIYNVFRYQTIFNDLYDPYDNKLDLLTAHQMRDCQVCIENNNVENAYFNDDYNEPRVFNVLLGLQRVSPEFTSGDYKPLGGFDPLVNKYPPFYSVHGMSQMIDLTWGLLKYKNNLIGGQLLSGEYQYAYRYRHQTGYVSPWSPLTAHVFLTTDQVDSANWTKYQMQQSGAQTNKGIQLELNYIDQRFQEIEVADLYWETESQPTSASSFFRGKITGSTMLISHQFSGAAITVDELVQRYTEIKKAKTGNQKDNTYHIANFETYQNLEIDVSGITIEPMVRPMLSDESTNQAVTSLSPPFTNQAPVGSQSSPELVSSPLADNFPQSYDIAADYINYKGTQWTHLFKGYFGGEIYPFAIVVFDRKGQPFFAQHIADFTLPQRYNNEWTDRRLVNGVEVITTGTTGAVGDYKHTNCTFPNFQQITDNVYTDKWFLNLIGLKLSGIDLTAILYDTKGELQVSGYSIVRTDRLKQLIAQGIVMCAGSTRNSSNTQEFTQCPTMFNGYLMTDGTAYPFYTIAGNRNFVGYNPIHYSDPALPYVNPALFPNNGIWDARINMAFFESPDYMIDNTILSSQTDADNMKLVGACVKAYGNGTGQSIGTSANQPWTLTHESMWQKNYRTTVNNADILTQYNPNSGNYDNQQIGDQVDIDYLYTNIQSGQEVFGSLYYNTSPAVLNYLFYTWGDHRYLARQINPTTLFTFGYTPSTGKNTKTLGILTTDEAGTPGFGMGAYFISNYIRPIGSYTITPSLLESRIYDNIGHFVPINQDILDSIFAAQGDYVFNNVNVWGGDCFLDYWTYDRLYAHLQQVNNKNQDYQIALSFPIESQFNIAMRQGNTYERFGGTPANTYNSGGTIFADGLYYYDSTANKIEDFNVNNVLQAQDTLTQYFPEPATFNEIYDFPVREAYTGTKIYGEKFDTYRKFPINNFRDADGSKGEINSLQNIFNYLYIIQRNGFARVRFNDRETITGQTTGSALDIGTALGLQGFDYINQIFGTQHQFSVVNSGRCIYWIDAEKGKFLRFGADGILCPSDQYGMHNFFTRTSRQYWGYDNPTEGGGITGVFDFHNQSVYYTFSELSGAIRVDTALTIEYSEAENQFKSFHSFTPNVYFNFKGRFFSPNPATDYEVYAHDSGIRGEIYGTYYRSKLKFVVNPITSEAKWHDNGSIAINNEIASAKIYQVSAFTENQTVQTINFPTDTRWRYLQGLVRYPLRAKDADTRLRGKSCTVQISVTNDIDDEVVRFSNHVTDIRLSPKL